MKAFAKSAVLIIPMVQMDSFWGTGMAILVLFQNRHAQPWTAEIGGTHRRQPQATDMNTLVESGLWCMSSDLEPTKCIWAQGDNLNSQIQGQGVGLDVARFCTWLQAESGTGLTQELKSSNVPESLTLLTGKAGEKVFPFSWCRNRTTKTMISFLKCLLSIRPIPDTLESLSLMAILLYRWGKYKWEIKSFA